MQIEDINEMIDELQIKIKNCEDGSYHRELIEKLEYYQTLLKEHGKNPKTDTDIPSS